MSQLQAVDDTQSTPQTRNANTAGARRGPLRSRASFLLPNGGNRTGARTPGTGQSQQQQGSGDGGPDASSALVDYSAEWEIESAKHVLGYTASQAKQNMENFTAVVKMTNDAAKGFKSEMGKRTKAELLSVWTGDNKLYDVLGRFDAEVSEALLQGDWYRLASEGPPEEADYFACEDYRKIIYASWPLTQHQLNAKNLTSWDAHTHIHHLTAHQSAFADVKVRSLVLGETSIPKTSTEQEGTMERYEQMVNDWLEPCFKSKYLKVVKDGPQTPPY